jgi:hypothetical protein
LLGRALPAFNGERAIIADCGPAKPDENGKTKKLKVGMTAVAPGVRRRVSAGRLLHTPSAGRTFNLSGIEIEG